MNLTLTQADKQRLSTDEYILNSILKHEGSSYYSLGKIVKMPTGVIARTAMSLEVRGLVDIIRIRSKSKAGVRVLMKARRTSDLWCKFCKKMQTAEIHWSVTTDYNKMLFCTYCNNYGIREDGKEWHRYNDKGHGE